MSQKSATPATTHDPLDELRYAPVAVPQSHKLARTAPLWMLNLRHRSRGGAIAAAAALTAVIIFLLSMTGYMVPLFIAVFMIPLIPGTILGTANVLPAEVNAQLDTFTFMSVMPTLFVVVVGAIVMGLVAYKVLKAAVRYIFSLWAVVGLNTEVFEAILFNRTVIAGAPKTEVGKKDKKQRMHLSEVVDSAMGGSVSRDDTLAQEKVDADSMPQGRRQKTAQRGK